MGAASNKHFLNNLDVFDTYGVFVIKGSNELLTLPKRKESLSYNWPEENGTEIDLSAPTFEDREVKLSCGLLASSDTQYHARRKAFIEAIAAPGWQQWRAVDNSTVYSVRYVSTDGWDKKTNLKGTSQVVTLFQLNLVVANEIQINVPGEGPALPVTVVGPSGQVLLSVPSGGTLQIASGFSFGLSIQPL